MASSKMCPLGQVLSRALLKDVQPISRTLTASRCTNIPDSVQGWYVQELEDSQKSQTVADRSREVSGQQTAQMFGSGFMHNQLAQMESAAKAGSATESVGLEVPYDADGNANLESVLLTNLPEPYRAEDELADLKEGLPEGLSDMVRSRGSRWTMENRLDNINGNP